MIGTGIIAKDGKMSKTELLLLRNYILIADTSTHIQYLHTYTHVYTYT